MLPSGKTFRATYSYTSILVNQVNMLQFSVLYITVWLILNYAKYWWSKMSALGGRRWEFDDKSLTLDWGIASHIYTSLTFALSDSDICTQCEHTPLEFESTLFRLAYVSAFRSLLLRIFAAWLLWLVLNEKGSIISRIALRVEWQCKNK